VLQRRLQAAERQAADLRRQLTALDPDEPNADQGLEPPT
jgi:hypothetical protein